MDRLLRPGTGLLRRFALTGKFVTIAVVLLVPLALLSANVIVRAADTYRRNVDERGWLTLVGPTARLVTDLHQWRIAEVTGEEHPDLGADAEAVETALDAAEARVGKNPEIRDRWGQVHREVMGLVPSHRSRPGARPAGATRPVEGPRPLTVARHARSFLDRVVNTSHLLLEDDLGSYHLTMALTDRLPTLLDAAATAAEDLPPETDAGSGTGSEAVAPEAAGIARQLAIPARDLSIDLRAAVASTGSTTLDATLRAPAADLEEAVTAYVTALTSGPPAPQAGGPPGHRLAGAAGAVITVVTGVLDELLDARGQGVLRSSAGPVSLALLAVLASAYLFAALARITSGDARRILADIHTLTTGALHQTRPLPGPDEFAQMSHAVVAARDRLTSLLGTLRYQATHDELTGLANRALLAQKLTELLDDALQSTVDDVSCSPGVAVFDLDGVTDVNDSFGHVIGDRLLRSLGARFHRAARRRDLVARLGPEQFAVLIADAGTLERATGIVTALRAALEQPVDVDGRLLRLRSSVGLAVCPDGGTTSRELLRSAEVAMHAARSGPAPWFVVFEPAMQEATRDRTELSLDLVQAVERQELTVFYQPIVDLVTQQVTGAEALLRWNHPTRGMVSPVEFVPLAEATGLIGPIGRWVMREAVHQLARWGRQFPDRRLTMDINLSADQLSDPDLVGDVLSLIGETGVDPSTIVLEITESAVIKDFDAALLRLSQLSAGGVRVALDDFGTGYSSLSYLHRLPVNVLKIDKSFVRDSDGSAIGETLLQRIVDLGAGLGIEVIAEGIETPDQARRLREAGCLRGQGFLWSRPVPPGQLHAALAQGPIPTEAAIPRPRPGTEQATPAVSE